MLRLLHILLGFILLYELSACVRRPAAVSPLTTHISSYQPVASPVSPPPNLSALEQFHPPATTSLQRSNVRDQVIYEQAYQELAKMLDGRTPLSFKKAIFLTENAYLNNQLSFAKFERRIAALAQMCRLLGLVNESTLLYSEKDRDDVIRNAAIFQLMRDSIRLSDGQALVPFRYDFEDFTGERDWTKMFVNKLLATHTGNCHSLPFLYKMLADETGTHAWLALAPNHIYLKQYNRQSGWYNTELTSYTFPVDAWLMASGYISKETVVSGIYMDTLSTRQCVALCLVDLAKGYERKVGRAASVALAIRCTELTLQHFPTCVNARLLLAESLRLQFEHQKNTSNAPQAYAKMEAAYLQIFQTGYRDMPTQFYADWLQLAKNEQQKTNTKP